MDEHVTSSTPTNGRPAGLPFVAFSVLLLGALVACGNGGEAPIRSSGGTGFDRLEQNESYTADLAAPAIFVARRAADVARFRDLTVGSGRAVEKVDFDAKVVVGVFRGQVPSGGHRIVVRGVEVDRHDVRVAVELVRPPGAAPDALAYPYELIAVNRSAVPSIARWVMVGPDGTVLAETRA